MVRVLSIVLLAIILGSACKKYPEDKALIHFRKPEKRVHKESWRLEEYTVDGVDSIPYLNQRFYWKAPFQDFEFVFKEGEFVNNKNDFKMRNMYITTYTNDVWEIRRLDKNDWDLIKRDGGKIFSMKLKRVKK